MRITRETTVGEELAKKYWLIYKAAFEPLKVLSPCRQSFNEEEFMEEMTDERVLKFVLWDDEGDAVAMSMVAVDLSALPWISPEYFAARFPEQFAAGTIYYFGTILVPPEHQNRGYMEMLLEELENFVVRNDGIAAFDCYGGVNGSVGNNEWLPEAIRETTARQADLDCIELEPQHYWAYPARGFKPGFGPSQYA